WSATQVPHILKTMSALTLGIPEHQLRVIAPDVGGGFGGKLAVIPEEFIALLVAQRLGKPVKWTESRSESMMAAHHGRDQIQDITICAKRDGTLTGLKVELLADMGAYLGLVGPGVPILGAFMFDSIYKFPAYRFTCTNVFTNTMVTDDYRGAGRPEATYAIERIMDKLAVELGMDPTELRKKNWSNPEEFPDTTVVRNAYRGVGRPEATYASERIMDELAVELGMDAMELQKKNWINHDEFPYTTVATLTYDSGNYEAATEKAMELFDYEGLRREQRERRERGDAVQLGIGISTYTEMCGLAPSRVLGSLDYGAGGRSEER